MGPISKSEPIFTKLSTRHSRLNSVSFVKFRGNRNIFRVFGAPFTLNRKKIYMGAISKSEPISNSIGFALVLNELCQISFNSNQTCDLYFVYNLTWTDRPDGPS